MHIKKTLTSKRYKKKSEEKLELQKRKSNLFNEKLELIKISKYTQKNIHTQQHYVLTHKGEKQWSKTTQHGLSVKRKKKTKKQKTHTHIHTHAHAHQLAGTHTKQKPSIFQQYTQSTTQIQNYFTMLPFLIQKMPILGVYIYIFQWFTVDLFLNILVLLHATVSCI